LGTRCMTALDYFDGNKSGTHACRSGPDMEPALVLHTTAQPSTFDQILSQLLYTDCIGCRRMVPNVYFEGHDIPDGQTPE
jgi:hypothetical protein